MMLYGQVLHYAQEAGQWSYPELQERYQQYTGAKSEPELLSKAHQEEFGLKEPLDAKEFNNKQHLIVIGNAADDRQLAVPASDVLPLVRCPIP